MCQSVQILRSEWASYKGYDYPYLEALERRIGDHRGSLIAGIVCGLTSAELATILLPIPAVLISVVLASRDLVSAKVILVAWLPVVAFGISISGLAGLVCGTLLKWRTTMHFVRCAKKVGKPGVAILLTCGLTLLISYFISQTLFWIVGFLALFAITGILIEVVANVFDRSNETQATALLNTYRKMSARIARRPRMSAIRDAVLNLSSVATKQRLNDRRLSRVESILDALDSLDDKSDWLERFIVRRDAILMGGTKLLRFVASMEGRGRYVTSDIRQAICHETLRCRRGKHICLDCFCLVERYESPDESYWSCRKCGGSHRMIRVKGPLIAVLQQSHLRSWLGETKPCRVNWSAVGRLFDFDRVEIYEATDVHVERFVVQIRNEADELQRKRIKRAKCCINGATLNENSIRQLKRVFRSVQLRHQFTLPDGSGLVLNGQQGK